MEKAASKNTYYASRLDEQLFSSDSEVEKTTFEGGKEEANVKPDGMTNPGGLHDKKKNPKEVKDGGSVFDDPTAINGLQEFD
jgi:hypothetical protein